MPLKDSREKPNYQRSDEQNEPMNPEVREAQREIEEAAAQIDSQDSDHPESDPEYAHPKFRRKGQLQS